MSAVVAILAIACLLLAANVAILHVRVTRLERGQR